LGFLRGIRTVASRRAAHARAQLAGSLRRRGRRRPCQLARLSAELVAAAAEKLERHELERAATILAVRLPVRPLEQPQRALEWRQLLLRRGPVRASVGAHAAHHEGDRYD